MYEKMMNTDTGEAGYVEVETGRFVTQEEWEKETSPGLGNVESESREMEIEEAENPALDELLSVLSLDSPLIVEDHAGREFSLSNKTFLEYYMPKGASRAEVYHCYQAVRASGLSLLIPGECYFFKTGDGPIKLFTGYPAWLRMAYKAGLEYIEKPDIEFGEDGLPILCTITLKIKDRPDVVWPTWFEEVAGTIAGGKLNKRWTKAPRFQLIKCATVNALRFSGLVDFTLPHIVDEMPDAVAEGHRTLTQEQLDAHQEVAVEAEDTETSDLAVDEVSATHHQVDLTPLRKAYFAAVMPKKTDGIVVESGLFRDDDQRHRWQEEISGSPSASDLDVEDYAEAFRLINSGEVSKWVAEDNKPGPDLPDDVEGIKKPEEPKVEASGFAREGQAAEGETIHFSGPEGAQMTEEETERFFAEEQAKADAAFAEEEATKPEDSLEDQVAELLDGYEGNILSAFLSVAVTKIPQVAARDNWITTYLGKSSEDSWAAEDYAKGIILLNKLPDAVDGPQDNGDNLAPIITDETYKAITKLVSDSKIYPMMRSKVFRDWAQAIIGHPYRAFKTIREHEGQKILTALQEEQDAAHEELAAGLNESGEIVDDDPLNQGEHVAPGDPRVNENDKELIPDDVLTDVQYALIKHHVEMMPDRFRMGTETVRSFITVAIKDTDPFFRYSSIRKLTEAQGAIVIAAQKDFIRAETDKINAVNKPPIVK